MRPRLASYRGLTLFEVMVAMVIMVTVMVMLYEAMSSGISFSNRGKAKMDALEHHTAVLDLLHRQIHAAVYDRAGKKVRLKVDADRLSFVTLTPLIAVSGPVFVSYRVDYGRLYYLEKRDYFNEDYLDNEPDPREMTVLLADAGDLAFAESDDPGGVTVTHRGRSYTIFPRCLLPEGAR